MAQVKKENEIEYIEEACRLTDEIFKEVISFVKIARKQKKTPTELEIQKLILQKIKDRKLRPSFPPIVTSGKRAGNDIHPKPTEDPLSGFVIVDLGVRFKGYCSDMTRMLYVGIPSEKEKILYETILKAQLLGLKHARSGMRASDLDALVRNSFGVLRKYFVHTLGHGVGRKIHEPPMIYEKRIKPILSKNMIITIEPGVYIPQKCGIRIEDTLVVTDKTSRVLTQTSKKLILV